MLGALFGTRKGGGDEIAFEIGWRVRGGDAVGDGKEIDELQDEKLGEGASQIRHAG